MKYLKKFNESIYNNESLIKQEREDILRDFENNLEVNESNKFTPKEILDELTLPLKDAGLYVIVSNHDDRGIISDSGDFFVKIDDNDRVFCKEYPYNDMDWLHGKPIIDEFFKDLDTFGLIRDKDYKVFGGGLGVTLSFTKEGLERVKL